MISQSARVMSPIKGALPTSPRRFRGPDSPSPRGSTARTSAARSRSPLPRGGGAGGPTDGGAPAWVGRYKYNCWVATPDTEQQPSRELGAGPAAGGRQMGAARPRAAQRTGAAAGVALTMPRAGGLAEFGRMVAVVAGQLRVTEEEAGRRLQQLELLLPDLRQQLSSMDPALVARLAADVGAVTRRLLQLRAIFPEADAFKLAQREPFLVLGASRPRLERAAKELRRLLPGLNVDRLVEDQPSLLDVKALRGAMKEFRRAEPTLDVAQALKVDPSMVFRFSFRHHPNVTSALCRRTAAALAAVPAKSG